MEQLQFLNEWGDFLLKNAQRAPDVYFPLVNESHMISSVTPYLAGDCKTGQNTYLLAPASEHSLKERISGRNFWVKVSQHQPWSAVGCSASQIAALGTDQEENCELRGGMLWQTTKRTHSSGLIATVTNFVPCDEVTAEVMQVELSNPTNAPVKIECIAAVPVYGRSADNVRDHRHVTSLLHRAIVRLYGLDITPTLTFDERGHQLGTTTYRVWGADETGNAPEYIVPLTSDFEGCGNYQWPESVISVPALSKRRYEGQQAQGGEMTASLYFAPCILEPGQIKRYQIVMSIDSDPSAYLTPESVDDALQRTKDFWRRKAEFAVKGGQDVNWTAWMRWVSIQPVLRRICGCSFLPHHDYGRGGRGWRDLWQDSLALILTEPQTIRASLLQHFAGVRPDGTNATIIGTRPGEFIADRNNIPRVWMDHGFWPLVTCELYLNETGDFSFLFEQQPYFDDGFAFRGEGERRRSRTPRKGTVLEHLLVQNVTAFFDAGKHGYIRLRGADWNDGLDMAAQNGESVAFTAAYAGNLMVLAQLLHELSDTEPQIRLHRPLWELMQIDTDCYADPQQRAGHLYDYCEQAYESREEVLVDTAQAAEHLKRMGEWMFDRIRTFEWVSDGGEMYWFNSYYDDHSQRVEGLVDGNVRMMLTGQVFTLMSGVATKQQAQQIARAADWYLYDAARGGYYLNTDFHQVKTDLGRMFGFAYGTKENGAVFSHMAVMYAYALYSRGMATQGLQVLNSLYRQSTAFSISRILPGIPEYFDLQGKGMYPYLTGAASWMLLTIQTRMFGVRGNRGALLLQPELCAEQFTSDATACICCKFAGKQLEVVYHNPKHLEAGEYKVAEICAEGSVLPMQADGTLSREQITQLPDQIRLDVLLERIETPCC